MGRKRFWGDIRASFLTIGVNNKKESAGIHSSEKGKKNGVPPYTNLVNLKSNTMKNTLQRYDIFLYLQIFYTKNSPKMVFS